MALQEKKFPWGLKNRRGFKIGVEKGQLFT